MLGGGGGGRPENPKIPIPVLGLRYACRRAGDADFSVSSAVSRPSAINHVNCRDSMPPSARTYTSISDVVAPTSTKPGAGFKVKFMATRGGEKVAVPRRASGKLPAVQAAARWPAAGKRAELRPTNAARAASGSSSARAVDHMVTSAVAVETWSCSEEAPVEVDSRDVGWLPGPVGGDDGRPSVEFTGLRMGVRDRKLSSSSTARQIMAKCAFSSQFSRAVVREARAHVAEWHRQRSSRDGTERAWDVDKLRPEHVELWFAVEIRHAAVNKAIPVESFWSPEHWLYDAAVAEALPYDVYRWLNRHLSFGSAAAEERESDGSDAESGESEHEEPAYDPKRKRRALSDMQRRLPRTVFAPGQDICWDDFVRWTRHMDGRRIRYKAGGHTGVPNEGLSCCTSKFFIYWEEEGWTRAADAADADAHGSASTGSRGAGAGGDGRSGGRASRRGGAARGAATARGRGSRGGRGRGSSASALGDRCGVCDDTAEDGGAQQFDGFADGANGAEGVQEDEFEAAGWSPPEGSATGVASLPARMRRALACLQPRVGHRLWLDRGLANIEAMEQAVADGVGVSAMMPLNRVGLPRRALAALQLKMQCPRACKHQPDSVTCNRFKWCCMHKGIWELHIMADCRKLVVMMTSCTSATRAVTIARTVGRANWWVKVPEAIGLYVNIGRGGTDTGDQLRRMLDLGSRRRQRQGPKGALFDAELCFVDGSIIANDLRESHATVWDFAAEYASEVLAAVRMRGVVPAAQTAAAEMHADARLVSHVPINFRSEGRKARRNGEDYSAKCGARCCMRDSDEHACDAGETQMGVLFCAGCARRNGCNGWYHEACYWRRHAAVLR